MGMQEKIMKIAMDNALKNLDEQMPQMNLLLQQYKNWQHEDLLLLKNIIEDISSLLEGTELPIKPDTVKAIGTIALINADKNEEKYKKVKKLIDDLKILLKD
jgi:hypothetical protein